ncbi:hypothetical protein [Pseudoalteromonas tunicata]|jgi:predicted transglutaminase-like cysteine proteinase|uniref:Uncharacterized protein n=1 Tax=Pseudoalteromonas tunicata D2 TaxID=87626 RepID=A4C8U8_9GAMM|nr:hypothetical protein [Pseudoalteromonas tunicata]ATC93516.1 hypothetical protein PTUN_a0782 [Pseudoalteromonas tunicata]AXT29361.1 hypothetical protein D1819_00020 [Pseudoalteromonas tunicata]EAR29013.1 hypothetical protein PTD2_08214 [Pseudoalteromonas tunicata D2]
MPNKQNLALFENAHHAFYGCQRFEYMTDREQYRTPEHWRSLLPQFNAGQTMRGDCEDAALTVLELALLSGVDKACLAIARVATEVCPKEHDFDHAVAVLLGENGAVLAVSDNRFSQRPQQPTWFNYRWFDCIAVNALATGAPATLFKQG